MICFITFNFEREVGGVKIKGLNDDDRLMSMSREMHITKTPIGMSSPKAGEPYARSCH
jgi:hypothetical protein